jgi:PAS domain S-box-containing protein
VLLAAQAAGPPADELLRRLEAAADDPARQVELGTRALERLAETPDAAIEQAVRFELGLAYLELRRLPEARAELARSADIARRAGDEPQLARSLANLATVLNFLGEFDEAIAVCHECMDLAARLQWASVYWKSANALGTVHDRRGEYAEAIDAYRRALHVLEQVEDREGTAVLLNNIAVAHLNLGDLDAALETLARSRVLHEALGDQVALAAATANLADAHHRRGAFEQARALHLEALALREAHATESDVALSLMRLGDACLELGEHDDALEKLERAAAIQRRLGLDPELASTLGLLARAYAALDRPVEALDAGSEGLEIADALRMKGARREVLRALAESHERAGDLDRALALERAATGLDREIWSIRTREQLAGLRADLQASEHRSQIESLRKDNALKDLALRHQRLARRMLLMALVLLLGVAALGWTRRLGRRRTGRRFGEQEDRFRLVTEATRDAIYDWDMAAGVTWRNRNYREVYGAVEGFTPAGRWWEDQVHADDRPRLVESLRAALDGDGDRWSDEYRLRRSDGTHADVVEHAFIVRDDAGDPIRMIGAVTDVTGRKRREQILHAVVEGTASAVGAEFFPALVRVTAGVLDARVVLVSTRVDGSPRQARTIAVWKDGRPLDNFEFDLGGTPCESVLQGCPEFLERGAGRRFPALAGVLGFEAEGYCGLPLHDSAGRVIGHLGIATDHPFESDPRETPLLRVFVGRAAAELNRQQAEQRQHLMMRELDHRVKNNLASIVALAEQAGGRCRSLEEFLPAFTGRVRSLAVAHEMLAQSRWEGAELGTLIRRVVQPYAHGHPERVSVDGPPVILPTNVAPAVCMVLHELATNAAKYGALAGESARLDISWSLDADGALCLRWVETGVPAVAPAPGRGFGTTLVEGLVIRQLRGQVDLAFEPDGLRCEARIPFANDREPNDRPDPGNR